MNEFCFFRVDSLAFDATSATWNNRGRSSEPRVTKSDQKTIRGVNHHDEDESDQQHYGECQVL